MAEPAGRQRAWSFVLTGLLPFFIPYAWLGMEIALYLALKILADLTVPWSLRKLVDDLIPSHDMYGFLQWVVIIISAIIVGSLATYRRVITAARLAARIASDIRQRCLERVHAMTHQRHIDTQKGDMLARLTGDVDVLHTVVEYTIPVLLFEATTFVAMAVYATILNGMLAAMILLLAAPVFTVMYMAANRRLQEASHALQNEKGKLTSVAEEQLSNQLVIKTYGLESWAATWFHQVMDRVTAWTLRSAKFNALLTSGTNLVYLAVRLLVLAVGGALVMDGSMTLGALVAFVGMVGTLLAPFITLADRFAELQTASGAFARVHHVLQSELESCQAGPPLARPVREIRFEHVTVRYPSGRAALDDVTVVIPMGSRVAVVGSTGAGKTTFLSALLRLCALDAGIISIDGQDISSVSSREWRRQIAFVPQDALLFNFTVSENVALGRSGADGAEIEAALCKASLHRERELGVSGEHAVGEHGARLSAGQRQRVAVARALLRDAPILLLDEATSAIDATTETAVLEALDQEHRDGHTIIFATHRLAFASRADLILVLDQGVLVEKGTHADLLRNGGIYSRLVGDESESCAGYPAKSRVSAGTGIHSAIV
jgi:ABC-type multidrug transport system fused ATPase/permease subunit